MSILHVTPRTGEDKAIPGQDGVSVMDILRDNGIDELPALCGGHCSCATCHIYVEEARFASLPPASEDENDLLDSADQRRDNSRLSCQILWSADLDGLKITIAPDD